MAYEEGEYKKLSQDEEIIRQVELRSKYLSDLNTNIEGAKREGYEEGIRMAIRNILKNKPEMQIEEIAELLEIDIEKVVAIKNEYSSF